MNTTKNLEFFNLEKKNCAIQSKMHLLEMKGKEIKNQAN